ncbi:MAG: hypothetical protein IT366_20010 [Candidatus Hydrogenedentes bacterium]|nr:hypothetical protein [Candidatus Hydrogenedentota bacterium]
MDWKACRSKLHLLVIVTICAVPAFGQEIAPSSEPKDLCSVGGKLYFSADDGNRGRELWVFDSQSKTAKLVKDIWPGERASNPAHLTSLGTLLLFAAETPANAELGLSNGTELWVSDGSDEGTQSLGDLHPGVTSGFHKWIAKREGIAYFEGNHPDTGAELWRTDGTIEGTRLAADIWQGPEGSDPSRNNAVWLPDGRLVLMTYRDARDVLLSFSPSDGQIEELKVVHLESNICGVLDGAVYFTDMDNEHGWELWRTDGTPSGTLLFKDIYLGASNASPGPMILHGGRAYFKAADKEHGSELWVTDGTESGTRMVKDIYTGVADSSPFNLTSCGDYLYFAASSENFGIEIWRSDGTEEGTFLLSDINPGLANSDPYGLTNLNGKLLFGATSSDFGVELWGSDGSSSGTILVKDIVRGSPATFSGNPYGFSALGPHVYFRATTIENGVELWHSDGSLNGTELVEDLCTEIRPNPSSAPSNLTALGDTLYFVAHDAESGNELWRTINETAELVRDIFPGPASSNPHDLTPLNNTLYFGADDGTNGDELWLTDGTAAGTKLVQDFAARDLHSGPKELTVFQNTVFLVAWTETHGEELCMVKDMAIHRVRDINPGPASSQPRELVVAGGRLYFRANDGTHGEELWESGGTEPTTRMVLDAFRPTTVSELPAWLTPVQGQLFFVNSDEKYGMELWYLGPKRSEPRLFADVARGYGSTMPDIIAVNQRSASR